MVEDAKKVHDSRGNLYRHRKTIEMRHGIRYHIIEVSDGMQKENGNCPMGECYEKKIRLRPEKTAQMATVWQILHSTTAAFAAKPMSGRENMGLLIGSYLLFATPPLW